VFELKGPHVVVFELTSCAPEEVYEKVTDPAGTNIEFPVNAMEVGQLPDNPVS
jgi:hypothetical protein